MRITYVQVSETCEIAAQDGAAGCVASFGEATSECPELRCVHDHLNSQSQIIKAEQAPLQESSP